MFKRHTQALAVISSVALTGLALLQAEARPAPIGSPTHDFFGTSRGDGLLGDIVASASRLRRPESGQGLLDGIVASAQHASRPVGAAPSAPAPVVDHHLPWPTAAGPSHSTIASPLGEQVVHQHAKWQPLQGHSPAPDAALPAHGHPGPSIASEVPVPAAGPSRPELGQSKRRKRASRAQQAQMKEKREKERGEHAERVWQAAHEEPPLEHSQLPPITHSGDTEAISLHEKFWLQQARLRSTQAGEAYTREHLVEAAALLRRRVRQIFQSKGDHAKIKERQGKTSKHANEGWAHRDAVWRISTVGQLNEQRAHVRSQVSAWTSQSYQRAK